jgi:hypothetical protein
MATGFERWKVLDVTNMPARVPEAVQMSPHHLYILDLGRSMSHSIFQGRNCVQAYRQAVELETGEWKVVTLARSKVSGASQRRSTRSLNHHVFPQR